MEDRETPVLYLEMTEADARRLRARPGQRRAGAARGRAGDVVAQRLPRPSRPPARAAGVRHPRGVRVRPVVRRAVDAERHLRTPLPAHAPSGSGAAHRQAHGVAVARADQPDHPRRGAGVARLGRLRAPQPHRRGRRARLHDDHALRERDGRRSALPALLRVRRPRRRGHVQADASAGRGAPRRVGHARVRGVGGASRAAHRVRQLVRGSARLPDCLRSCARTSRAELCQGRRDAPAGGYLLEDQGGIPRKCCSLRRWSQP